MTRLARWALSLVMSTCALYLASCAQATATNEALVRLRIAGSTSMAPVVRDLAVAYQARRPNTVIDVGSGDTASGLVELISGRADLAAISWHPRGTAAPRGLQAIPIARDAIAVIVNARNPLRALTLVQIKALYQGEILNWQALGGPDLEPVIVSREDGSGTRAAFEALALGSERVTLNALVMPASRAAVEYVAAHPAAVAYVSAAELTGAVRALDVEGLAPSSANVRSGAYHLTRTLYFYAPSPAAPGTQAFIDFVLSPAGQTVIGERHTPIR